MTIYRVARAAALGLCASLVVAAAEAAPIRFFDAAEGRFVTYDPDRMSAGRQAMPGPEFMRQIVDFATTEAPGTVIVDSANKHLYFVLPGQQAIRYGVGVGREGFGWAGTVRVGAKQEWPSWTPPAEMIERRPELIQYAGGMPGGENNPLGARALYLYDGGRDTMFRIHGTNEPWSIGQNVSSGCIRMLNQDVTELYSLIDVNAKVIVM
jgi:lipoprotein-anchoring transpeptidase ErfK/SrfK